MRVKGKKRRASNLTRRQQRAGLLFLLPWIFGFLIFFLRPCIESFYLSFTNAVMGVEGIEMTFVGLSNYKFLLVEDSQFLRNTLSMALSMVQQIVICSTVSLLIATVLVKKFHGRTVYRSIMFLPVILTSGVVYSMIGGVVGVGAEDNAYLGSLFSITELMTKGGISASVVGILKSLSDSVFSMMINCGVPILLYISALQKIPASTYEAARMEGANAWDLFWKITVPKIAPVIFLNIVYIIVDASTAYGKKAVDGISIDAQAAASNKYALQGENPMMEAILDMGFRKSMKFGMSAAMAWMFFALIAIFLVIAYLLIGRRAGKMEE